MFSRTGNDSSRNLSRIAPVSAVLALGLVFTVFCQGCSKNAAPAVSDNRIVVLGSDTMEELVRSWGNGYMTANPGIQVNVSSGDTGAGITELIAGRADVASASRELTPAEDALAHKNRVHLTRVMVARDSIAVIVNPQNKLTRISLDDLRKVYKGEIKTWDKLTAGGPAEPIRAFGREATSGTSSYFHEHVMENGDFDPQVKLMPSSEAVIGGVFGNRLAIGFVGMSQAEKASEKVRILELGLLESATRPTDKGGAKTLTQESYPLSRPLYLIYRTDQKQKLEPFVKFAMSSEGRKDIAETGFMTAP